MIINYFKRLPYLILFKLATLLLLFADSDFETSNYKRELCQKMLISIQKTMKRQN